MNIFSAEILSLLIGLITGAISLIWRVAKTEKEIYERIDNTRELIEKEITIINHKIDLLKLDNSNEHESFRYLDHSLKELIDHRTKRLERWIYDISSYLEKETKFVFRRGLEKQEEQP